MTNCLMAAYPYIHKRLQTCLSSKTKLLLKLNNQVQGTYTSSATFTVMVDHSSALETSLGCRAKLYAQERLYVNQNYSIVASGLVSLFLKVI